jgi:hypothetical protein
MKRIPVILAVLAALALVGCDSAAAAPHPAPTVTKTVQPSPRPSAPHKKLLRRQFQPARYVLCRECIFPSTRQNKMPCARRE